MSERTNPAASAVFVVTSGRGVEQVFAHREDAEQFVDGSPELSISRQAVRRSFEDAVAVVDRRVVVAQGRVVVDDTSVVHRFFDDPRDVPQAADVEWFEERAESLWHIRGFGIDRDVLDTEVRSVIAKLR